MRTIAERLASKLLRVDGCLEFQGYRLKGYGRLGIGQKLYYAHRVAYALAHDVPLDKIDGWLIIHTCDNPACCEPKHLIVGTSATNMADAVAKGHVGHPHFLAGQPEAMRAHMRKMGLARHGLRDTPEGLASLVPVGRGRWRRATPQPNLPLASDPQPPPS